MLKQTNDKTVKEAVIVFAGIAYLIGVGYADLMFLQIVQKAFPGGILSGLAYAGAIVAGMTALMLPIALHWWFAPGRQFFAGVVFYLVDLTLLGANAILAYQISLGHIDSNLAVWYQYCPATPVICASLWGLCFALDPSHKTRHVQQALHSLHIDTIAKAMEQSATSPDALQYLNQVGVNAMWQTAYDLSGQAIPQQLQISQQAQSTQQPTIVPALPAPIQIPQQPVQQQSQGFVQGVKNFFQRNQQPTQPVQPNANMLLLERLQQLEQNIQQMQTAKKPVEVTGQIEAVPTAPPSPLTSPPLPPQASQSGTNGAH